MLGWALVELTYWMRAGTINTFLSRVKRTAKLMVLDRPTTKTKRRTMHDTTRGRSMNFFTRAAVAVELMVGKLTTMWSVLFGSRVTQTIRCLDLKSLQLWKRSIS